MRLVAVLLCCLFVPTHVVAKPNLNLDEFAGDRYRFRTAQSADDVTRTLRCPAPLVRECQTVRKKKRRWKRYERPKVVTERPKPAPPREPTPTPRARPAGAPEPDEESAATNAVWERIAVALRGGKEPPRVLPVVRLNIFEGFAREIARALPGRSLKGVVGPLAAKAQELVDRCGSRVISAVRHTYVAGTRRISLHASGRAVDMAGSPGCMYAALRGWRGGYSIDYARVRHIHISWAPPSRGQRGREWGLRFVHRHVGTRTRYARHIKRHRTQYASAR